ncbi:lysine--tRNA ligase [Gimesia panareensis]|uniref:lysine--tRNA ligase n=1 Tax=Gimesia panareensis TaxID=2527978 RepID=UPI00118CFD98|nr:lysine--tRNA ligase [Gimesia panareensis]QDU52953.1 Lysine--tRNA ligase [Gimesia panareensis]
MKNPFENPSSLVKDRIDRISELRDLGINPYPPESPELTHSILEVLSNQDSLIDKKVYVKIAGRVIQKRKSSKILFVDLLSEGNTIQIVVPRDVLQSIEKGKWLHIQSGDVVAVYGQVMRTQQGQTSVRSSIVTILSKPTHPLPLGKRRGNNQVHGSAVRKDYLFQKRHIDLLANPKSRDRFEKKAEIIRIIRNYLHNNDFLEVHTNIIGDAYSGAAARPFKTVLNALNQEMFLRVSPECYLKRLLCGGLDRIYELGPQFRNEGIDASHNPEFLMVEWYEAYSDYLHQMKHFETIVSQACFEVNGTYKIKYQGEDLDFSTPWRRLSMIDGLQELLGCDVENMTIEDMPQLFKKYHPEGLTALPSPLSWGNCILKLWDLCESQVRQPTFVVDYPFECSPLTKSHRNDDRLVERFEPHIVGMEVGNAYSEQNDPIAQYESLEHQHSEREEQYDIDEEFVNAICNGMPPAGGAGLGVDRIVMLLTDAASIRDDKATNIL